MYLILVLISMMGIDRHMVLQISISLVDSINKISSLSVEDRRKYAYKVIQQQLLREKKIYFAEEIVIFTWFSIFPGCSFHVLHRSFLDCFHISFEIYELNFTIIEA